MTCEWKGLKSRKGDIFKVGGKQIPSLRPPQLLVTSIGAGDAFDLAFLQGILEGKIIKIAAKVGITAALVFHDLYLEFMEKTLNERLDFLLPLHNTVVPFTQDIGLQCEHLAQ